MPDEADALVRAKIAEWAPRSHEELSAMVGGNWSYAEHELLARPDGAEWMLESEVLWDSERGGDLRVWVDVWVYSPEFGKVLARDELFVERPGGPAARSPKLLRWLRRMK